VALNVFYRQTTVKRFEMDVREVAEGLLARTSVQNGRVVAPELIDARSTRALSGRYWQIAEPTPQGLRPLARSASMDPRRGGSPLAGPPGGVGLLLEKPGQPFYYDTTGSAGEPVRAVAIISLLPGRTEPLVFMAAQDRSPIDRDARRFAELTGLSLILLGAGLLAAVFFQVRIGLGPLFLLGREIADIRKGKAQRLVRDYPQEIQPLAEELNVLLDNNQQVVERQRTHVGNLAHALKTPLSVMLTEAGAEENELADVVRRQATIMRGQVDHHLRRARAAARAQGAGERTPVEDVIEELAVMLERVFQEKGVEIDWRVDDDLCFRGERQDLQEIVGNIMENACKYGHAKVWITAGLGGPGRLWMAVEDDGPGLPADSREDVVKRGSRLDETAPGSGLGLSIVDELARAYGGSLALEDSPMGGLKVVVELPAAEV